MKLKVLYVCLLALWMGSPLSLSAQNKGMNSSKQRPTPEQVMQLQVNQMVRKLMLDDATTAKFVPVYEKYLTELRDCRLMCRKQKGEQTAEKAWANLQPQSALTDAEIKAMLKNRFAQSRKMLDIREKYYHEFSKVLSQKQILKIYQQEKINANQFRKEFDRRKGMRGKQGRLQQGQRFCPKQGPGASCPYSNR